MAFKTPFHVSLHETTQIHEFEVTFSSEGSLTAPLTLDMPVAATLAGDSYADAIISGGSSLIDASLIGDSSAAVSLQYDSSIPVTIIGDSVITGDITHEKTLIASVFGDSTLVGAIAFEHGLAADILADSSQAGLVSLQVSVNLPETITGESSFIADAVVFTPVGFIQLPDVPIFRVVVADLSGVELEELPYTDLSFNFILNDSGSCGFDLPMYHPKVNQELIAPGKRDLYIYRDDAKVWGGRLWSVQVESEANAIKVSGADWMSLLERRYIDEKLKYTNEDVLNIAWKIINWAQTRATFGITRDSTALSGETASITFHPLERIKLMDAIRTVAEGFDFEVTPDKKWRTFHPERGSDIGVVFELGKNIEKLSYSIDAATVVTEMTGLGAGDSKLKCVVVATDTNSLAEYGLIQDTVDFSEVKNYDRLAKLTAAELRTVRRPTWQPQLSIVTNDPDWGAYNLGDTPRIRANDGFLNIDKRFRIIAMNVKAEDEGQRENIELYFDESTVGV